MSSSELRTNDCAVQIFRNGSRIVDVDARITRHQSGLKVEAEAILYANEQQERHHTKVTGGTFSFDLHLLTPSANAILSAIKEDAHGVSRSTFTMQIVDYFRTGAVARTNLTNMAFDTAEKTYESGEKVTLALSGSCDDYDAA